MGQDAPQVIEQPLSVSDFAKLIKSYPKHVRRLIKRGELPGSYKSANTPNAPYQIPAQTARDYIEAHKTPNKKRATKPGGSAAR